MWVALSSRSRYLDRTWEQKVRRGFWEASSHVLSNFRIGHSLVVQWLALCASTSGGWTQSLVWNRDPACHTVRPKQKQTKRKNSRATAASHTQKTDSSRFVLGIAMRYAIIASHLNLYKLSLCVIVIKNKNFILVFVL